MIKKIIRNLTPPIIYKCLSLALHNTVSNENKLFDGDDFLFKDSITKSDVYAEYGCGESTIYVSKNFDIKVYSVESDIYWKRKILTITSNNKQVKIYYANLGNVGEWGKPKSYKKKDSFYIYTDWIWKQKFKPTIVLIDGRFRVCCFLTSLINAKEGTKIIFDDYNNREFYHYIEKFLKPTKKYKRQSLFIVPKKKDLNVAEIKKSIASFRNVFD